VFYKNDRTVSVKEGVEISYILNTEARKRAPSGSLTEAFSLSVAESVRRFHQSFPQYDPTPLVTLTNLARNLKVANIWISKMNPTDLASMHLRCWVPVTP
jgi:hypothetical protein